jgi:hypothetical protein
MNGAERAWTTPPAVGLLILVVLTLSGCHPLLNPIDPTSPAYGGVTVERITADSTDPDPLPAPVRWESYRQHASGLFLPLEITTEPLFVEPRSGASSPAGTTDLILAITFDSELSADYRSANLIDVAAVYEDTAAGETHTMVPYVVVETEGSPYQLVFQLLGVPAVSRCRIRLRSPDSRTVADLTLGVLGGDVNGSGTVDGADSSIVSSAEYLNTFVEPEDPVSIRADARSSGVIDLDDGNLVTSFSGRSLPEQEPSFIGAQ